MRVHPPTKLHPGYQIAYIAPKPPTCKPLSLQLGHVAGGEEAVGREACTGYREAVVQVHGQHQQCVEHT